MFTIKNLFIASLVADGICLFTFLEWAIQLSTVHNWVDSHLALYYIGIYIIAASFVLGCFFELIMALAWAWPYMKKAFFGLLHLKRPQ